MTHLKYYTSGNNSQLKSEKICRWIKRREIYVGQVVVYTVKTGRNKVKAQHYK